MTYPLYEDAASDLHQNRVARRLLRRMTDHFREDHAATHWSGRATRIGGVEVVLFPGATFGWGEPYEDLVVVLGPVEGQPRGGSGHFQDGRPFVRLDFALDPTDLSVTLDEFCTDPAIQAIALHELIHYLDAYRNPVVHDERDHSNDASYFNSPEEFNAFFHNIADDLLGFLDVAHSGVTDEYLGVLARAKGLSRNFARTVTGLLARAGGHAHQSGFLDHLDQRNTRAVLKRLYQLHQDALPYLPA